MNDNRTPEPGTWCYNCNNTDYAYPITWVNYDLVCTRCGVVHYEPFFVADIPDLRRTSSTPFRLEPEERLGNKALALLADKEQDLKASLGQHGLSADVRNRITDFAAEILASQAHEAAAPVTKKSVQTALVSSVASQTSSVVHTLRLEAGIPAFQIRNAMMNKAKADGKHVAGMTTSVARSQFLQRVTTFTNRWQQDKDVQAKGSSASFNKSSLRMEANRICDLLPVLTTNHMSKTVCCAMLYLVAVSANGEADKADVMKVAKDAVGRPEPAGVEKMVKSLREQLLHKKAA